MAPTESLRWIEYQQNLHVQPAALLAFMSAVLNSLPSLCVISVVDPRKSVPTTPGTRHNTLGP
jgi:hypothetical protein